MQVAEAVRLFALRANPSLRSGPSPSAPSFASAARWLVELTLVLICRFLAP